MADLTTTWLGLELVSPFVIGASPLGDDLAGLRALIDAGAGAVVLHSVFEEQILAEQLAVHHFVDSRIDTDAEARSFLPESATFPVGPDPTLAHLDVVPTEVVHAAVGVRLIGGWRPRLPWGRW
jgi:dihydroorotate dehydrogenase (fumarate)